jgi:hypothetical protein
MVKIGFIVEGGCERIVLRSNAFTQFLQQHRIERVGDVIDLDGKGNLTIASKRMETQVRLLRDLGASCVVVLRDLDDAPTHEVAKQQVYQAPDVVCCLAVKELEAWFLADSMTLSLLIEPDFFFEFPEEPLKPIDVLKELRQQHKQRGIGDKKGFASVMVNNGFTIEAAARHPNCPSAQYFLTTLQTLASAN